VAAAVRATPLISRTGADDPAGGDGSRASQNQSRPRHVGTGDALWCEKTPPQQDCSEAGNRSRGRAAPR